MFNMGIFKNKKADTNHLLEQAAIYFETKNIDEAIKIYRSVLHDDPDNVVVLNETGRIFLLQNNYAKAAEAFGKAASLKPELAFLHRNLAATLSQMGLLEKSFAAYRKYADITHASERASLRDEPVTSHKALHDQEQFDYLHGKAGAKHHTGRPDFVIQPAARVESSAINPNISAHRLFETWQHADPKLLVIDDLLTDEALQRLRQFCWGSTVWNRVYKNGYLGALPEHGFGSPLLAQIIEELRDVLSPIVGNLPLLQFWAFKYSSKMKGVDLHADFSAININLWITPDEATDDPDGGGLVIWDKPAPLDWDFKTYNQNEHAAREFLAASGAKPTTIPHRSNRAIIFNPSLFHETDRINFKPGYINRRINITFLFGRREEQALLSSP